MTAKSPHIFSRRVCLVIAGALLSLPVVTGCASAGLPAGPAPRATTVAFVAARDGDTIRYARDLMLPISGGKSAVTWRSSPLKVGSDEVIGGVAFVYELGGDVQVSNLEAVPMTTDDGVVLEVRFDATTDRANSTLHVFEASANVKLKSEVPYEPRA